MLYLSKIYSLNGKFIKTASEVNFTYNKIKIGSIIRDAINYKFEVYDSVTNVSRVLTYNELGRLTSSVTFYSADFRENSIAVIDSRIRAILDCFMENDKIIIMAVKLGIKNYGFVSDNTVRLFSANGDSLGIFTLRVDQDVFKRVMWKEWALGA